MTLFVYKCHRCYHPLCAKITFVYLIHILVGQHMWPHTANKQFSYLRPRREQTSRLIYFHEILKILPHSDWLINLLLMNKKIFWIKKYFRALDQSDCPPIRYPSLTLISLLAYIAGGPILAIAYLNTCGSPGRGVRSHPLYTTERYYSVVLFRITFSRLCFKIDAFCSSLYPFLTVSNHWSTI